MKDIVPRLRKRVGLLTDNVDGGYSIHFALLDEAADEIEQLRIERDKANDRVALLQHEVRL
jgi:hypothetical protein